jgi:acyl-homoserine lactone acylase PvdQ
MKKLLLILFHFPIACSPSGNDPDVKKYEEQASHVTIIRDKWGVPHVYGKTDADAVFGLMYAQCEESFERVERNYIEKLGRQAEVDGEAYLYNDLLMRLLYDTSAAITDYKNSPAWLKKLLNAFADGINYYLYKHPEIKPALLKRFEPWFPLLFTDGGYTAHLRLITIR